MVTQKWKTICDKATKVGGASSSQNSGSSTPRNDDAGAFPFASDDDGGFPSGGFPSSGGFPAAPGSPGGFPFGDAEPACPEILQMYSAPQSSVFVCADCFYVLVHDKFLDGAATKVTPASGSPALLTTAITKYSMVVERKERSTDRWILLAGNRELQLWDCSTGQCLIHGKPVEQNKTSRFIVKTFMLASADLPDPSIGLLPVVVASSVDQLYIFRPRSKNSPPVVIEQKVCPSVLCIAGTTLISGNMDGLISVFALTTGEKLRELNITDIDPAKPRGIITQMRSRVNSIEYFDGVVLTGFEDGDVCAWDYDREEQEEALKHHEYKDCSVKDFIVIDNANPSDGIYVCHVKKTDKTEELTKLDFDWKRLRKKLIQSASGTIKPSPMNTSSPRVKAPTLSGISEAGEGVGIALATSSARNQ
eukprot:TRINITY_DN1054_c0_g1_i1.p1 TRINITY_DN1054_c0_g1~~TRINITY_DN1054_c0_g1_i1.p1  ORF type:complete len:420 (-),score=75.34 TRINITY_DN1054_c0_g1_i1:90-1349(-)